MLYRTVAVLALFALLGADAPRDVIPWKLDRSYRYLWFHEDRKVGDIVFRFRKVEEVTGTVYRLTSHRRHEHNGQSYRSQSDFYFLPDRTPLRYEEESRLSALSGAKGRQEVRIRFQDGRVICTHVNNGKEEQAVRTEAEVDPDTRLFSTWALEQWALLALELDGKEEEIDVFCPTFGKTITLTFTPEHEDATTEDKSSEESAAASEEGEDGRETSARQAPSNDPAERLGKEGRERDEGTTYRFRNIDYRYEGRIRVDARGRLVRYQSGPLKLVLDTPKAR